ncbi:MAG: diguanylate cyclase [Candidatus Melainabacteria bacterium]|nr:diguanylate cyclase [Candidatus Melainabacteria bacterium]
MLRFSKHDDSSDLPMATLSQSPTAEDLQFALSQAQRNWRRAVALAFKASAHSVTFTIFVQCEMGTGEPIWTLKRSDEIGLSVVWSHKSMDVHLIQSLLAVEFDALSKADVLESTGNLGLSGIGLTQSGVAETGQGTCLERADTQSDSSTEINLQAGERFVEFYKAAIASVISCLCDPTTGIFTYESFIYFLDQEYRRYLRGGQPFSVIVFQMCGGKVESLPMPLADDVQKGIILIISTMIRDIDLIGHYGRHEFVLLLPHTDSEGAATLARRIRVALDKDWSGQLLMNFGVASIPSDGNDPCSIMALAEEAKNHAVAGSLGVMMYRDLY